MVERRWFPGVGGVAHQTFMRVVILQMVIGAIVIVLMARPAIGREVRVIAAGMTFDAAHAHVRSRQRELRLRVVERRRLPRRGCVALLTRVGELVRRMVRIISANIIRLVTRPAIRRCAFVLPADVTLRAGGSYVCAGQWERGLIMIKRGRRPTSGRVTLRARLRILPLHMVRIDGTLIIGLMA